MASLSAHTDTVRTAVASVSTCSPATTAILKSLLPARDSDGPDGLRAGDVRSTSSSRPTKSRTNGAAKAGTASGSASKNELSAKDQAALATHVINASLKALSDAARAPPSTPGQRHAQGTDLTKAATRNNLQRSNSTPMTPLQPRTLNRTSTSPVVTTKHTRAPSSASTSSGCMSVVECARVAFAALRTLQASSRIALPELQLEAGMSSFVGKLLALGLLDQATKELRTLKRRLDGLCGKEEARKKQAKATSPESTTLAKGLCDLLDFHDADIPISLQPLVITTQLQALRVLALGKKAAHIEAAVPYLRMSCKSSPVTLLLSPNQAKTDQAKLARQLETVSQSLLSLTPSVSSKDDGVALEARMSISPRAAFELQALGLEARLHWWQLAGHKGDVDKDIVLPFSRCLAAFARRESGGGSSIFEILTASFDRVSALFQSQKLEPSRSLKAPIATIYQLLGTSARESGHLAEAVRWFTELKHLVSLEEDSVAKFNSISAQLLSLHLKDASRYLGDEKLLQEVVDGIQGPLKGDTTELDELLQSLSLVRRSALSILLGPSNRSDQPKSRLAPSAKALAETFIFQFPRFCLRWLGKPPASKGSTKDFLRYEQRRQFLAKSIHHTLDSALMIMKVNMEGDGLSWDRMDAILHDCRTVLEYMGDMPALGGHSDSPASSYYVKFSHFYFVQFISLSRKPSESKEFSPIRALRKSIECVKHRSIGEKEKAQFTAKLEKMAELCKSSGRSEDCLEALQSIRTNLVEAGVLDRVAQALKNQQPSIVWATDDQAQLLSRTLTSIAKMEPVWVDWTVLLPEPESMAAIEHMLHMTLTRNEKARRKLRLGEPAVEAFLRMHHQNKHPLRRLRGLLRLLTANLDQGSQLSEIQAKIIPLLAILDAGDLGEDGGLAPFVPHFKALFESLAALMVSDKNVVAISNSISAWKDIVASCGTKDDLLSKIDCPADLLNHLESVADFMRMSGEDGWLCTLLELSAKITGILSGPSTGDLIKHHSSLALECMNLGQSSRSEQVFELCQQFVEQPGVSTDAIVGFHLSFAEYLLDLGKTDKVDEHLDQAHALAVAVEFADQTSKSRRRTLVAYGSFLYSVVALDKGDSHHALVYARNSVKILFQDWSRLESQLALRSGNTDAAADEEGEASFDKTKTGITDFPPQSAAGPEFWGLSFQLFRSLLRLSTVYGHLGMFQETMYYAEQAQKIANAVNSHPYRLQSGAWLGSIWLKAGEPDKAIGFINESSAGIRMDHCTCRSIALACQLSAAYRDMEDAEAEARLLAVAETMITKLAHHDPQGDDDTSSIENRMATLSIKEPGRPKRATRQAKTPAPRTATRTGRNTKAATTKAKSTSVSKPTNAAEDFQLTLMRTSIMMHQAASIISRKDWVTALDILQGVHNLAKPRHGQAQELITMAACLIGQSMEQITRDPVFSVVQDSTLSFPAVCGGSEKAVRDRLSLTRTTPPAKARSAANSRERTSSKDRKCSGFVEYLQQAQDYLLDAHSLAAIKEEGTLVQQIGAMLQGVAILLSAATSNKPRRLAHPGYATCSIELARNLVWRRERKALLSDKSAAKSEAMEWPMPIVLQDQRRSSLGFCSDVNRFQKDYVDIIPKTWSVVTVALSDNKHDLCITKLEAGHSPFVIRLPLERASSRDVETEVFNFHQGRSELLDIIKLANATCHDARDMSAKGAKSAWWAEREELDNRMRDLLDNIEQVWLAGFKGVFSQHRRLPDLLARFQKSFQNILDKHLPSRRQVRGRRAKAPSPKVTLDPRILDLFIGLGDATAPDCDFDDPLTDLLYFVVDILQFNGERNAYDEIDFDEMVVETFDALHSYHSAAKDSADDGASVHAILVLDKSLHVFPWESLPCMQGLAISRVPSLACLRRLILEQQPARNSNGGGGGGGGGDNASHSDSSDTEGAEPARGEGHHISRGAGTYILNPSGDLASTQATFSAALATLPPSWTGTAGRPPSEDEFARALAGSDVLLYFGHGSGAQYVRGRTVRRLDKCRAAALLMGCSSASLADVGGFECHGPVWNYMLAGCPAVAGTLWDVTDRDIDRFAGRVFEEWGLFAKGTFQENAGAGAGAKKAGKRRAAVVGDGVDDHDDNAGEGGAGAGQRRSKSLVEAIAAARGACRFRYLTAAAVCVYGIPVYIDE